MATIVPLHQTQNHGTIKVTWETITDADSGGVANIPRYPDMSIQLAGDFSGAATITVEGSNDGSNYATLNDTQGVALATLGAAGVHQILENTEFIRLIRAAGDGSTDIDVTIHGHGDR